MIVNPGKCKYVCTDISTNSNDNDILSLNKFNSKNSHEKFILEITTDQKSSFTKKHIMHTQGYLHPLIRTKKIACTAQWSNLNSVTAL